MSRIRTWFSSLRTRLLLLVFLAVIPACVLAYFAIQDRQEQDIAKARLNGLQYAQRAASIQGESIQAAHQLLASLARLDAMSDRGPIACNPFATELLRQYPFYAVVGVIDEQGNPICQSPQGKVSVNLKSDAYFRRVIESADVAIGEYGVGTVLGEPAIQIAVPMLDESGRHYRSAFAALKNDWFASFATEASLPANSTLVVSDRTNALLLHYADVEKSRAALLSADRAASLIRASSNQYSLQVTDTDQIERLYAYAPIYTPPIPNSGVVGIGLTTEVVFQQANAQFRQNIFLLGVVVVCVLAIAWVFSELFFLREIRSLSDATQQLSAGNWSARTRGQFAGGELVELARRFNGMAETLQQRESERAENESALHKWADIFQNTSVGIIVTNADGTRIDEVNPAYAEMHGYTIAEMQGMVLESVLASEARASLPSQLRTVSETKHLIYESKHLRKDGTVFPVLVDATAVTDLDGKILYRIANVQDLTSIKQAEQAEREQRAFAESLRDTAAVLTSTLDFDTVLDRILDNVKRVMPHTAANIMLVEAQVARVVRSRGYRERDLEDWLLAQQFSTDEYPILRQVMRSGKPYLAADTRTCADWIPTPQSDWVRSSIHMPLCIKDKPIGILVLLSDIPSFFNADHINQLHAFADQAAIALENARLLQQAGTRADQMALLYDAGLALNSVLDPTTQIEFLLKISMRALGAEHGEFFRCDSAADQVKLEMHVGIDDTREFDGIQNLVFRLGEERGIVGTVAAQHLPVNIGDLRQDPRWIPNNPALRSGLWVPIQHEQRVLGVICLFSVRPNAFSNKDERLLVLFANQVAVAIENARLFNETRRRTDRLTLLNRIARTINQSLELDDLLENIRQEIFNVLPIEAFYFALYDEATGEIDYRVRYDLGKREPPVRMSLAQGLSLQVVMTKRPVLIRDREKDPQYPLAPSTLWGSMKPARCWLGVPIMSGNSVVGIISIQSYSPNTYSDEEVWLLMTIADQVASGLKNARLFAETRRQLAETEAINRLSNAMRTASNAHDMIAALLNESLALLNTRSGEVLLFNPAGELAEYVTQGWFSAIPKGPLQPSGGISWHVFTNGKTYIAREYASDPLTRQTARPFIPNNWGGVAIPIGAGQQVFGVLHIATELPSIVDANQVTRLQTLAEITGNAVQRVQLHEQTELHLRRLNAMHIVDTAISGSLDLRVTLDVILDQVTGQLGVDAADILLSNTYDQTLTCAAARGFRSASISRARMQLAGGYPSRAILEHQVITLLDLKEVTGDPRAKDLTREGFIAYAATPLIAKGQVCGVLELFHRAPLTLNSDLREFFQTLAGQAAIAVENITTFAQLQKSTTDLMLAYDSTIEAWARLLDARHREHPDHSRRVAEMTVRLAQAMGIDDQDLSNIRRGALLHDTGKINIPESILFKTTALTQEEQDLLKQHTTLAHQHLAALPFMRATLDIPYCQDESWDGTGSPKGLIGDQIPLAARVFAVAHAWVEMRYGSPQNPARSAKQAREHLQTQSGKRFDPNVVRVFFQLLDSQPSID